MMVRESYTNIDRETETEKHTSKWVQSTNNSCRLTLRLLRLVVVAMTTTGQSEQSSTRSVIALLNIAETRASTRIHQSHAQTKPQISLYINAIIFFKLSTKLNE